MDAVGDVHAKQGFPSEFSAPISANLETLGHGALSVPTERFSEFLTRSVLPLQDFVVSFFVELSVMMLERLYLDPGAKEVWSCCAALLLAVLYGFYQNCNFSA